MGLDKFFQPNKEEQKRLQKLISTKNSETSENVDGAIIVSDKVSTKFCFIRISSGALPSPISVEFLKNNSNPFKDILSPALGFSENIIFPVAFAPEDVYVISF